MRPIQPIFIVSSPIFRGVIIVIDSVNFPQETRDLAHLVIEVLSEPTVHTRRIPILFACNKQG